MASSSARTSVEPRPSRARLSSRLLIGVALGAVVGVVTSFAQADLSGAWASLANAASPWLVAPFVAGSLWRTRAPAIAAGLLSCVVQVGGYYVATSVRGFPVAGNEIVFWTACAVVGGPLFGWAGWAWRHGSGRVRPAGAAMVPATFVAEALGTYAIRLHYVGDAVLFAGIGALLLVAAVSESRVPRRVLTAALAFTVAGTVLYGPVLDATAGVAFGA